jgi:hypothetical protein
MSKQPLFDLSTNEKIFSFSKTVIQGALGAMTFGAYHQFVTNKIMELNNEKMEIQHKSDLAILELKHKEEMKVLLEKLEKLESKSKSWW